MMDEQIVKIITKNGIEIKNTLLQIMPNKK